MSAGNTLDKQLPAFSLPGPTVPTLPDDNWILDKQLPVVSRLIHDSSIENISRKLTNNNAVLYVDKLHIDKLYISKLLISELAVIKDNFNKIIKSLYTDLFTKKIHDSSIESKPKELTNENGALLALPPTLPGR